MNSRIEEIWTNQESGSNHEVVREKIEEINKVNCFIGFIGRTGARMFQLEVQAGVKIHPNYLNKFRGIVIQNIPVPDSDLQRFSIILLDNKLKEIFLLFIVDLLERLKFVENTQDALLTIHQRVTYWKQLFAHVTGETLSPALQRGLYGELIFLKSLLESAIDKETILNSWKGAESANQDFALNNTAIEIKTSKAGVPNIHISSEHQLDYTNWGNLFLGIISVNESAGHENTLTSLIQEIIIILEDRTDLSWLFKNKLSLAGIPGEEIENYNNINYLIRRKFFFKVEKEFPLIAPFKLNDEALFNVRYQIDILRCKSFEVNEDEVLNKYYE